MSLIKFLDPMASLQEIQIAGLHAELCPESEIGKIPAVGKSSNQMIRVLQQINLRKRRHGGEPIAHKTLKRHITF